jgi:hypothetical protein
MVDQTDCKSILSISELNGFDDRSEMLVDPSGCFMR